MDYYKILNLNESATLKEIEQAYKDLYSFYNPENNVSKNAYKKFREVNEAYRVLSEIKQKEMYDRLHVVSEEEKEVIKGELVDVNSYLSSKINVYKDYNEPISSNYDPRNIYLKVSLSYLYYLTGSDYEVRYLKKKITYLKDECECCNGKGKVRLNGEVSLCPKCFGEGRKCEVNEINESVIIAINDTKIVLDEDTYKVIIEFDFYDKEFFKVNNDEIFIDYKVNEEEYHEGISFNLNKGGIGLQILSNGFNSATYTFLDKIIHINYILDKYEGRDVEAYLLSDKPVVYLNLNDFSYKSSSDETHTYKLTLNSPSLILEGLGDKGYHNKNGNLIVKVIKVKNEKDEYLFFDKKIKKVSANLFKYKGKYNGHMFKKNKGYDYDEEYIYLPSKAYKLKSKSYLLFKIIYSLLYIIIPLALYFIMGFNLSFIITTFVLGLIYLISVNLLMEVRI